MEDSPTNNQRPTKREPNSSLSCISIAKATWRFALEETALIEQVQHGDTAAFEELVRRYEEIAFRVAYLITADAAEAEDAAQEAFMRSFRAIGTFKAGRPFRPWLLRIVTNLALNRQKASQRRVSLSKSYASSAVEGESTIEKAVEANERNRMVWQAVGMLKEWEQAIIYLRYFLALPEQEVAEVLKCRPGTVKSRLHRALKSLREVVSRHFPDLAETWAEPTR